MLSPDPLQAAPLRAMFEKRARGSGREPLSVRESLDPRAGISTVSHYGRIRLLGRLLDIEAVIVIAV